jgi:hypothetical protein
MVVITGGLWVLAIPFYQCDGSFVEGPIERRFTFNKSKRSERNKLA